VLEITEGSVMTDEQNVLENIARLNRLGVMLNIDDFGTGYSSLAYLKQLPLNALKIDKSFVRDITIDPDDAAIAQAVIQLAHNLGIQVVAEGVETEAQLAFLQRRGCDAIQGYLFSKPLPAAELTGLLHENRKLALPRDAASAAARTLLIVDDEENIRRALVRVLRNEGYQILTAAGPTQAFELLARQPVGVILSDQRMPEMIGTEFLGRVKAMYPETVRIVLSGYTELQSVTDAINRGAVYKFLTKPWDDELLRANLREAFRYYALTRDGSSEVA
jgi:CheY-like chemotaxis protein